MKDKLRVLGQSGFESGSLFNLEGTTFFLSRKKAKKALLTAKAANDANFVFSTKEMCTFKMVKRD